MDNLQWFKFSPADWMMGRIQRQSPQVQVDFLRLCCKYWQKDGDLSIEDSQIEAMDSYDALVKYKIIKEQNRAIVIDFLDEQFDSLEGKREQASKAGIASAEARRLRKEANGRSTTVQRNPTPVEISSTELNRVEKSREEKRREDENRQKEIRELTFREQVAQTNYSNEMKDAFCNYWTESKTNGKKMRFEMQKTFDIARRLVTWSNNDFSNKIVNGKPTKPETPEDREARLFMETIKDYNTHKNLYGEDSANEKFKFNEPLQSDFNSNRIA